MECVCVREEELIRCEAIQGEEDQRRGDRGDRVGIYTECTAKGRTHQLNPCHLKLKHTLALVRFRVSSGPAPVVNINCLVLSTDQHQSRSSLLHMSSLLQACSLRSGNVYTGTRTAIILI